MASKQAMYRHEAKKALILQKRRVRANQERLGLGAREDPDPTLPSLHRALQHGGEFMSDYQGDGFTVGELSECAQEALNAPTKTDVSRFSFRGSHVAQNLQTTERTWMFSDPNTLEYDV